MAARGGLDARRLCEPRRSIGIAARRVLALALIGAGCWNDAPARAPAEAVACAWRVEYSSHQILDEPPRSSRLHRVTLAGEDVVRVTFVDASGTAGELENFDGVELELGVAGSAKLAELYGDAWEADAPLAGAAVLRIASDRADLEKVRLIVGHPAPIRILHSGDHVILRMPIVEGSLAKLPRDALDACK